MIKKFLIKVTSLRKHCKMLFMFTNTKNAQRTWTF